MSKLTRNEHKKQCRKKQLERKRFTEPIPTFLEVKYPSIFAEYKDLYETIVKKHGEKCIAMKTQSFKDWKAAVEQQCTNETQDNEPVTNEIQDNEPATNEIQDNEPATNEIQANEVVRAAQNLTTICEQPVEIVMPGSVNQEQEIVRMNLDQLADIMVNVEDQVNDIMAELRQDPDLRGIMDRIDNEVDTQPPDEGIDISPLDDIQYDIEPFDFQLEVENYNW